MGVEREAIEIAAVGSSVRVGLSSSPGLAPPARSRVAFATPASKQIAALTDPTRQ